MLYDPEAPVAVAVGAVEPVASRLALAKSVTERTSRGLRPISSARETVINSAGNGSKAHLSEPQTVATPRSRHTSAPPCSRWPSKPLNLGDSRGSMLLDAC